MKARAASNWIASIALIIAVISYWYENNRAYNLAREQFESSLILKAIVENDIESTKKNFRFLIEHNFISEDHEAVLAIMDDTIYNYYLPKIDTFNFAPALGYTVKSGNLWSARVHHNSKPIEGAAIEYSNDPMGRNYVKFVTTTDSNGLFKIAIPPGKTLYFSIYHPEYQSFTKMVLGGSMIKRPEVIELIPKE